MKHTHEQNENILYSAQQPPKQCRKTAEISIILFCCYLDIRRKWAASAACKPDTSGTSAIPIMKATQPATASATTLSPPSTASTILQLLKPLNAKTVKKTKIFNLTS
jgi:hypothetical protein